MAYCLECAFRQGRRKSRWGASTYNTWPGWMRQQRPSGGLAGPPVRLLLADRGLLATPDRLGPVQLEPGRLQPCKVNHNVKTLYPSSQATYSLRCAWAYICFFAFGDSIIDTGNFVYSTGSAPNALKEFPYGMTFFHHPTGRVCDGRVLLDFYAQALGLPLVQPSLPEQRSGQCTFGANFAVFAATALPPQYFKRWNMDIPGSANLGMQMGWFKEVAKRIAPGPDYDKFGCLKWYNDFSMRHNMALSNAVNRLRAQHPRVKLIYADYFGAVMEIFKNPHRFGQ
ncbi:GDSL esterase/lipase [Hordeum vulgare]|nr:GDSL esterase/lipase [Hordeum vulgare]